MGCDVVGGMPAEGDNFRTLGEWKICEGRAWHEWQIAGLSAAIAGAEAAGAPFDAHRLRRELRLLAETGPTPVPAMDRGAAPGPRLAAGPAD